MSNRGPYVRGPATQPLADDHHDRTAAEVGEYLRGLYLERALAEVEGLSGNRLYRTDLDDDIAAARAAYVGTAVTEIATLRAELSGRLHG